MKIEAALALGGNLDDPIEAFATALASLKRHPENILLRQSSVYRTAPWGKLDQPDFLNMAVLIETALSPGELLELCLEIERERGRERLVRWGPRTLDIDILTYGEEAIDRPGLQIPHPRIAERAFVLTPLNEIAPHLMIGEKSVAELHAALADDSVRLDDEATTRLGALLEE
ncbi:2-amino-4-hydroxy-6-hydroxymethyldihydropteridine diphosphokinase [Bosea sp. BK604]|uniref:2-amino-4-hydroxy-6- hydroxymethyldihydropteridine diphosphokinase n=1 Tax=Bosea sp. BK604 TaxID=2512180 RepID=UPI0010DE6EED|nr:2-amino-4-hydroxy-6-hydroxymethyldihydropteridine diphosphokinase [Bosea sp. BK604]TCR70173.1 2-amino-4-hydroxy-6-hydroxymethyldihydropteridine diphosphokinase [Bosea sp. BK604]